MTLNSDCTQDKSNVAAFSTDILPAIQFCGHCSLMSACSRVESPPQPTRNMAVANPVTSLESSRYGASIVSTARCVLRSSSFADTHIYGKSAEDSLLPRYPEALSQPLSEPREVESPLLVQSTILPKCPPTGTPLVASTTFVDS